VLAGAEPDDVPGASAPERRREIRTGGDLESRRERDRESQIHEAGHASYIARQPAR
jgi:hypothetical protein